MKKIRLTLCSLLVCLIAAFGLSTVVSAAAAPVCLKEQTLRFQKIADWNSGYGIDGTGLDGTVVEQDLYIGNLSPSAVVTNVKSSNKNFTAEKVKGLNAIRVDRKDYEHIIKNGEKTTISFTVKQNGKTYKLSSRVTFMRFKTVFKNFKLGSKDYFAEFSGFRQPVVKLAKRGTVKLQINPAAGYEIDDISITYSGSGASSYKTVKNGSRVSLKNALSISVQYHTTKKPAYYQAPGKGYLYGMTASPLHYWFTVRLK